MSRSRRAASVPGGAILGISCDFHDAAVALVVDGEIVAAAEEERFTRRKHDPSLPVHALAWCLGEAGIEPDGIAGVACHEKPFTTWERIVSSQAHAGPRGFHAFRTTARTWVTSKAWVGYRVARALDDLGYRCPAPTYVEHHLSHAAAAFLPSPFEEAAVLTFDGVGEWATSTIAVGVGSRIDLVREQRFPDSLGLFYSAMTRHCGFDVNDGEYKLMGLAPFGEPRYVDALREHVISVHPDGSVRLDQRAFDYLAGRDMVRARLDSILDGPPRAPDAEPGQREADIAASAQVVLEDAVLAAARHAHELTGMDRACLAGGVALNCVANARLLLDGPFEDVWVQPAAGDAGSAIGAALWHRCAVQGAPRRIGPGDAMRGAALGPSFTGDEVAAWLDRTSVPHVRYESLDSMVEVVAARLAAGEIVGWLHGPMEFGPRALGHRSILADPRDPAVAGRINASVKGREGFRPFAPAVLEDRADEWFDLRGRPSPYMLFTADVERRSVGEAIGEAAGRSFADRLGDVRSEVPSCTHVDGSARVQTVGPHHHPGLHALLEAFERRTGVPVLLNTSFNVAGMPIVRTPADALACARQADLDAVVLEDCVVDLRSAT